MSFTSLSLRLTCSKRRDPHYEISSNLDNFSSLRCKFAAVFVLFKRESNLNNHGKCYNAKSLKYLQRSFKIRVGIFQHYIDWVWAAGA
jgi:hypothetical protein